MSMFISLKKYSLLAAGTTFFSWGSLIANSEVKAAIVSGTLNGVVESGSVFGLSVGDTWTGTFSYDDEDPIFMEQGFNFISLVSLNITMGMQTFEASDDSAFPTFPAALLDDDGNFLGVDFMAGDRSLFFGVANDPVSGDLNTGSVNVWNSENDSGDVVASGSISYTSVPEPTSTLSLLALGTLGLGSTLLRKNQQE